MSMCPLVFQIMLRRLGRLPPRTARVNWPTVAAPSKRQADRFRPEVLKLRLGDIARPFSAANDRATGVLPPRGDQSSKGQSQQEGAALQFLCTVGVLAVKASTPCGRGASLTAARASGVQFSIGGRGGPAT